MPAGPGDADTGQFRGPRTLRADLTGLGPGEVPAHPGPAPAQDRGLVQLHLPQAGGPAEEDAIVPARAGAANRPRACPCNSGCGSNDLGRWLHWNAWLGEMRSEPSIPMRGADPA